MYSAVIDWHPNVYTGANESYTYIPIHTISTYHRGGFLMRKSLMACENSTYDPH